MDQMRREKIQAMNKYHLNHFFNNFSFYSSIAMSCSLLCFFSSPLWFQSLCSSMNVFLFVSLPNLKTLLFNPKFLFILCNIIVVFLIGESKFVSSKSSKATEIYDECVKRSKTHKTIFTCNKVMEKEKEMTLEPSLVEETGKMLNEVLKREEQKVEDVVLQGDEDETEGKKEDENGEEAEEKGLPADELKKRVEDFIARINKQIRLEAGLLVCSTDVY